MFPNLIPKTQPKTNEEYRKYMTHNALNIINRVSDYNYGVNNDPNDFVYKEVRPNKTPHLYDSVHDKRHPYGYETNAVKNDYLSKISSQDNEKMKLYHKGNNKMN